MAGADHSKAPSIWLAFLALLPFAGVALFASRLPTIASGRVESTSIPWVPSLGVELSFFLDGLGLLFALLVTFIGGLILLYSSAYMAGAQRLGRFTAALIVFMVAMLGVVTANNLILLYVFWELTTVASFMLIGFDNEKAEARRAARQGLLITGAGGLAMLAGFILLGQAAGTYELTEILASSSPLRDHEMYVPILVLVLVGAFTKSAQIPFHFWLPGAMAAPTPVSAYLHSATMVKAGVYLLARLAPTLGGTNIWMITLSVVGAATAIWASVQSLRQQDLKKVLAFTTLMALGTSVMFLGAAAPVGLVAAVTFVFVHALYKAALFMIVGAIDKATGTRELDRLGGLRWSMPFTAAAAILSALSMAGLPPFIGFVGKELLYKGALAWSPEPAVAITAIVLAKIMMVSVALVLVHRIFFGSRPKGARTTGEVSWLMWIGPLLLGFVALLGGLVPDVLGESLVLPAVAAVMGEQPDLQLALWHGLNVPFALSVATILLGTLLYMRLDTIRRGLNATVGRLPVNASQLFERGIESFLHIAASITLVIQQGRLRGYLRVVFLTVAIAVGATAVATGAFYSSDLWSTRTPTGAIEIALVLIIIAATGTALQASSRLLAIGALGVVGTSISLLFAVFGAPDLAVTQLLVETLVVVLAALVFLRLPAEDIRSTVKERGFDIVLAVIVGGVTALILMVVSSRPPDLELTRFFEQRSVPEGYGRNIVNVILVDFRAFDTLGEIVVVLVAALAGWALMRRDDTSARLSAPIIQLSRASIIVKQSSRLLMVLMLLFAVFMLMRGHNEPGGGFIGGLLGATAFALVALGSRVETVRQALRISPLKLSAIGLLAAVIAGGAGWLAGESFLTAQWVTVQGLKLGTPLLFDAGVALVVVGMMLTFMLGLKDRR